jgi:hypothetical protein
MVTLSRPQNIVAMVDRHFIPMRPRVLEVARAAITQWKSGVSVRT